LADECAWSAFLVPGGDTTRAEDDRSVDGDERWGTSGEGRAGDPAAGRQSG